MLRIQKLWFPVHESWKYLVKTDRMKKVGKSAFKFSEQLVSFVNTHPIIFNFQTFDMSREKVVNKIEKDVISEERTYYDNKKEQEEKVEAEMVRRMMLANYYSRQKNRTASDLRHAVDQKILKNQRHSFYR